MTAASVITGAGHAAALIPLDATIRATVARRLGRPLTAWITVNRGPQPHLAPLMPTVTRTHPELVSSVGRRPPCGLAETRRSTRCACHWSEGSPRSAERFLGLAGTGVKPERGHQGVR